MLREITTGLGTGNTELSSENKLAETEGPWKAEGKAREVCIRTEEDEDMKCPLNLVTTHW